MPLMFSVGYLNNTILLDNHKKDRRVESLVKLQRNSGETLVKL